jgi:TDG/mug DNA glycosylase family protein
LGVPRLESWHDHALLEHGFGFTDVVKRASARAGELSLPELTAGVVHLTAKLEHHKPRIACFHGVTGYRHVLRALDPAAAPPVLGAQELRIGVTRCFLVPNPSGANAHVTPADQTLWYDRLAEFLHSV